MQIILFSGKAEGGKTTVALMVKDILESKGKKVLKIAYGDLVKYLCGKYFNWDGNKDAKGREILQQIGTNVIRAKRPTYWVDFVKGFAQLFQDEYDYTVIDDCRFPDEVSQWDKDGWDTYVVRVTREGYVSSLTKDQLLHQSECALDNYIFDYYINSENGLDNLKIEVNKFIGYMEEN